MFEAAIPRLIRRQFGIVAVLALVAAGCGGNRGRLVQATALPAEYVLPHVQNAQTIDLSKLASATVSSERLERGDVVDLTITSGYERENEVQTIPARIGDDGFLQVPLVGPVMAAGLEASAAEQSIRAAAIDRGVYRNPNVTIVMKQQRTNKVTVVGAVAEPGTYDLPRGNSALLGALVAAGGLSEEAGTTVEIRRPAIKGATGVASADPTSAGINLVGGNGAAAAMGEANPSRSSSSLKVDLIAATQADKADTNWYLDDGDVVMVEKRDPQPVQVIGMVNKAGQFPLPANKDLHLLDAVALAGGAQTPYLDKVKLIRQTPGNSEPLVVLVSLKEAKTTGKGNVLLGAGDIVSVEQNAPNFAMDMVRMVGPYAFGASLAATLPTIVK